MAALFRQEYRLCKDNIPAAPPKEKLAIITGVNGRAALAPCIRDLNLRCGGDIKLLAVKNSFYGPTVTATGLLTGSCLLNALTPGSYDRLLLPANMLKFDEDIFLDDLTLAEVSQKLQMPITVADCSPQAMIDAIFK